jgi:hypothetical protein
MLGARITPRVVAGGLAAELLLLTLLYLPAAFGATARPT